MEESLDASQLTHAYDPSQSINLSNISIEQALLTSNEGPEDSIKRREESPDASVKTSIQALEELKKISDSPISDCLTSSTTKKKERIDAKEERKTKPIITDRNTKKEGMKKLPPVKNRNFKYEELKEYKLKELMK